MYCRRRCCCGPCLQLAVSECHPRTISDTVRPMNLTLIAIARRDLLSANVSPALLLRKSMLPQTQPTRPRLLYVLT
jgi:hypothetical protein